ncbi:Fic family protein [bacterium]|nr:Fic family protein [bacterium]
MLTEVERRLEELQRQTLTQWEDIRTEYFRLIHDRHAPTMLGMNINTESRADMRIDPVVFARESCLLSKVNPDIDTEYFDRYLKIARFTIESDVDHSSYPKITHPAITNAAICDHPHYFTYRTGSSFRDPFEDSEDALPIGQPEKYLRLWMKMVERIVIRYRERSFEERDAISIALHDTLIFLHPFDEANSRTARIHLQEIRRALGIPMIIFRHSETRANKRRIKFFDRHIAKPFMARHGRI